MPIFLNNKVIKLQQEEAGLVVLIVFDILFLITLRHENFTAIFKTL